MHITFLTSLTFIESFLTYRRALRLVLFKHMDQQLRFDGVPLMNVASFLLFDLHKCYIVCFGQEVSSSPWGQAQRHKQCTTQLVWECV